MLRTRAGYCGGNSPFPTYEAIGDHTEAISIDYDPTVITYQTLLDRFWTSHPCQSQVYSLQYQHAVFTRNEQQLEVARQSLKSHATQQGIPEASVTTKLIPIQEFTIAEFYHQKYRLSPQGEIRKFLEATYPDIKSFADSTVATRLNCVYARAPQTAWQSVLDELPQYGLSPELESHVRERGNLL